MITNLELYRVFLTVAKSGSITSASRELFVSQPAVSQAIKQLELQLGGKLFARTAKGMEPTMEGRAMLEYIERAANLVNEAENKFYQLKNLIIGTLRIGVSDNIFKNYLLVYVKAFRLMYPDVKIKIISGRTEKAINLLKQGKVDIAFVNMPIADEEIETTVCSKLHDCFVCGKAYAHLASVPLNIDELLNYPIILLEKGTNSRKFIDDYLLSSGKVCDPDIEVASHDLLIEFAKENMGIACLTEEFVERELESGALIKLNVEGDIRSRNMAYATLKNVSSTFTCSKFVSLIKENIKLEEQR